MTETTQPITECQTAGEKATDPQQQRTADERRRKERRSVVERRSGFDRRRGPGRRRSDDRRAAEEGEMTPDQFEFIMAINEYKRVNKRPFPTWTEVLDVMKALGYRKVAKQQTIS
jgi:hypothetical protein